eukprot:TRINITY_DN3209_c0_g1_i2.p1 TRINITY_DN3209_c0_g1~~TRINITY_DN3209_c0_g1_i2.p1  ORF type:complete len:427 (+),score=59.12 TRINITY_DN3209_c0_g1_i2:90-1370(+)
MKLTESDIQRLRQITVHPNLVLQLGVCFSNDTAYIVMVQMMNDLETLLMESKEQIPTLKKILMAKDAAEGIHWLHCAHIVHKNLKLKNLLVDRSLRVCVSDYWFPTQPSVIDRYTPPQYGVYSEKSDVYSFGICLYEIMSGQRAYTMFTTSFYTDLICNGTRPSIGENIPPSLSQLMTKCWAQNPDERPSFVEIQQYLNEAIVQEAIPIDKAGRDFWLESFPKKTEVSWTAFQTAFANHAKSYIESKDMTVNWQCLRALLVTSAVGQGDQGVIDIERFGKILSLFGPMSDIAGFFQLIESILKQKWFHGDMGAQECEAKLSNTKSGTYLVRFSSREVCYVVSCLTSSEVIHRRVFYKHNDGYYLENKHYKSLADLIRNEKRTYGWKHSALGSKYCSIFPHQPKPKNSAAPRPYPHNYAASASVKSK